MPGPRKFDDKKRAEIAQNYRDGLTISQISRLYDCSQTPIYRALRAEGVDMRNRGEELKKTRNENIISLVEQGYTYEKVAKAVNVTRQRVHQIVSRGY